MTFGLDIVIVFNVINLLLMFEVLNKYYYNKIINYCEKIF